MAMDGTVHGRGPIGSPSALFIVNRPTPQRSPLLDLLHARGQQVTTLYLDRGSGGRGWGGVDVHHPHEFVGRGLAGVTAVISIILSARPRTVAVFGYASIPQVAAALLARLLRIQLVCRSDSNIVDELTRPTWYRRVKRLGLQLLLGQRVTIWTIGEANEDFWRFYGFQRVLRIPYTLGEVPGRLGAPLLEENSEAVRILYVGRLLRRKGIDIATEVAERLASKGCTFLFVGEGPNESSVSELSVGHEDVRWLGSVEHARLGHVFRACDVLIVPSRLEPWGLVVLEGLVWGAHVVTTDRVGAVRDLQAHWPDRLTVTEVDADLFTEVLRNVVRELSARARPPVAPPDLRGYPTIDVVADLVSDALH